MIADPFAPASCTTFIGPFEALLRGLPDGVCLELSITPLTAFVVIAGLGLLIACLQVLVKGALFGRKDQYRSMIEDQPHLSLREAANRARADRAAGHSR